MNEILQIAEPVMAEFERFRKDFMRQLECETALLRSALAHVLRSNGKHLRPLLLLLTAKACGNTNELTHQYALITELLHTATLIHDDVVDETVQRRGEPSLNAVYDNRTAVLTGDYMLACAMKKAAQTGHSYILELIAQVCRELAEGELLQLENINSVNLNENDYFRIIRKKTASLISAAAEIGAILSTASTEVVTLCRDAGEYLGLCFQIKDDIFDYCPNANIGKPTGNDIREGKITLPLMYALNTSKNAEYFMNIITRKSFTPENIAAITDFAKSSGGIEFAERELSKYKLKAVELINELPDSAARRSLLLLTDYFACRQW
jgi:octaprenyl-diphosphate synthase